VRIEGGSTVVLAIAFLAAAALLSSCATLRFQQGRSRPQAQPPEEILRRYAYPEGEFERISLHTTDDTETCGSRWETRFGYTVRVVSETKAYVLHEIEIFPGASPVRFDYYMVTSTRRAPAVLVFPIFGGKYGFARTFADYFAKHGLHCALMYRKNGLNEAKTFAEFEPPLTQVVVDSKIAIDWLCGRPEVDPTRIGAFGISMGAIKSAVVKCLEPRVGPAVVALAGGTLADVLSSSREPEIVERREQIMRNEGIGIVGFRERANAAISTDPLKLAQYVDASEVKMIEGGSGGEDQKLLTLELPVQKPNVTVPVIELFLKE